MWAIALLASIPIAALAAGFVISRRVSPRGKGAFIRSVRHGGNPAKLANTCKAMGLTWVAIAIAWQQPNAKTTLYHLDEIPAYVRALEALGIDAWAWAWPEPGRAAELVKIYNYVSGKTSLRGLILNPEQPYQGASAEITARDVMILRGLGVPLGCCSYGAPTSWHPRFPWAQWAGVDFGMPELYDTHHKWGADHQERTAESWVRAGFRRIVPTLGASDGHTAEQMRIEIAQTIEGFRSADVAFKAMAWWDFYWLERSKARSGVVAAYRLGGDAVA